MNKPRSAALVASVAALALLTACAGGGGTPAEPDAQESYDIAVVLSTQGGFHQAMACGAQAAADDLGNVTLNIQAPPNTDVAAQVTILESIIASEPDAIVIAPTNKDALVEPLLRAKESGITVIFSDAAVTNWEDVGEAFIATDNFAAGELAAQELGEKLDGEEGVVGIFTVAPGITTTEDRGNGFIEGLKDYPNLEVLPIEFTDQDVAKAQSKFAAQYAANPDLVAVMGTSITATVGIAGGVREADATGDVTVFGFDTTEDEIALLRDGIVSGLVQQQPFTMGDLGVRTAVQVLNGEDFEAEVDVPIALATQENVDSDEIQKFLYTGSCL